MATVLLSGRNRSLKNITKCWKTGIIKQSKRGTPHHYHPPPPPSYSTNDVVCTGHGEAEERLEDETRSRKEPRR